MTPKRSDEVKRFVNVLGGPTEVAKMMGLPVSRIQQWGSSNTIPWKWRSRLRYHVRKNNFMTLPHEDKLMSLASPKGGN